MLTSKIQLQGTGQRLSAAVSLAIFGFASFGQAEEPLVTDRPDFTESSSTVGSRILQILAAFTHAGMLNPGIQFDVRAARRLTDHGADILAGAGLSWRLEGRT